MEGRVRRPRGVADAQPVPGNALGGTGAPLLAGDGRRTVRGRKGSTQGSRGEAPSVRPPAHE